MTAGFWELRSSSRHLRVARSGVDSASASFGFLKYAPMAENPAIDARLGFAVKVRPVVEPFEHELFFDTVDHFASLLAGGVETEVHQYDETVEGDKHLGLVGKSFAIRAERRPRAGRRLAREKPAPQPSVATRDRSAAIASGDSPVRSLMTCQRMDGSESSSHLRCAGRGA